MRIELFNTMTEFDQIFITPTVAIDFELNQIELAFLIFGMSIVYKN